MLLSKVLYLGWGGDNFMCSWGVLLLYYAVIFTCFLPTDDVYSVVIVITTGGRLGGGLVGLTSQYH
jgi:hypothetical protein